MARRLWGEVHRVGYTLIRWQLLKGLVDRTTVIGGGVDERMLVKHLDQLRILFGDVDSNMTKMDCWFCVGGVAPASGSHRIITMQLATRYARNNSHLQLANE